MVETLEEADRAAKDLFDKGNAVVVVKAQIHAGGRGKGGGVKVVKSLDDASKAAKAILGMQLVTHQTGAQGQKVQRLLVEEGSAIDRELYLGIVLDRAAARLVFMASQGWRHGDRRGRARYSREDLQGVHRSCGGVSALPGAQPGVQAWPEAPQINDAVKFMLGPLQGLCRDRLDARWRSIPLITTKDDKLLALDCKINFDDNAMFRHKDLKELRDLAEEDPLEVGGFEVRAELHQARRLHRLHGERSRPGDGHDGHHRVRGRRSSRNFLDVGGGANRGADRERIPAFC